MFRIKICGVTNVDDALMAADVGADAIGLIFYPKSPRLIDAAVASTILKVVPLEVARVGVFVNEDVESLHRLMAELGLGGATGLHAIQIHGDEPPEYVATVRSKYLIRARRFTDEGIGPIAADLEACEKMRRQPNAILIDAATPGRYGGSATTVRWAGLADYGRWLNNVPLILAGGLTPDNVAEAIRIVRPHGVDVASGVESSPGKKDQSKVRDFVAAARDAFARI